VRTRFQVPLENWKLSTGVSSLHELKVINCEMDEDQILPMLQACRELRKFIFCWDQPLSDGDVMNEEWDFGVDVAPWIVRGLEQSRATMEVLDLSGKHPIRHDTMSLGNLTSFDHLLTLRVPAAMVINPDPSSSGRRTLHILPTSLKNMHLIVGGVSKDQVLPPDVLDFVRHEEWASALKTLTITWQDADVFYKKAFEMNSVAGYKLLQMACGERGIAFKFKVISRF